MTLASSYYPAFERVVLTSSLSGQEYSLAIGFDFFDEQSNLVCKLYTADGEETLSFSKYSSYPDGVSGVYADVSVVVPALTSDAELVVYRNVSNGQPTNFSYQSLSADTTENAFDKVHALIQDSNKWAYALTTAVGSISSPDSLVLPSSVERANRLMMFDENGDVQTRDVEVVLEESGYIDGVKELITALDGRVTSNAEKISANEDLIESQKALIEENSGDIAYNGEAIRALVSEVAVNKNYFQNSILVMEGQIFEVRTGINNVRQSTEQNTTKINLHDAQIDELQGSVSDLNASELEFRKGIDELEKDVEANRGAIEGNTARIEALEQGGGGGASYYSKVLTFFNPAVEFPKGAELTVDSEGYSEELGLWVYRYRALKSSFEGVDLLAPSMKVFSPTSSSGGVCSIEQIAQHSVVSQLEVTQYEAEETYYSFDLYCMASLDTDLFFKLEVVS